MTALVAVAAGGFLGGLARSIVTATLVGTLGQPDYRATLGINLAGSAAAGALLGAGPVGPPALQLGLAAGALGGFTTVSSFALQAVGLAKRGKPRRAAGYVAATLVLAPAAAALGHALAGAG